MNETTEIYMDGADIVKVNDILCELRESNPTLSFSKEALIRVAIQDGLEMIAQRLRCKRFLGV